MMKRSSLLRNTVLPVLLLAALSASGYQYPIGRPTGDTVPALGAGHGQEDPPFGTREMEARQLRRLRELHQKEVATDADRLLQLASALKADTDSGATATPGQLKDVDEIAKLAKRLADRIKDQ